MIRVLIIEDEEPAALRLEKLLKRVEPEITVIDILDSVETTVSWLTENEAPELLMLDIQLADGLSFEIFKEVKVDCFVIFTTAYDEYAIKAFELNSIDYLLKPIDINKLELSIRKFKSLRKSAPKLDINSLVESIESRSTKYKRRFAISLGTKIKSIEINDIALFYSLEKNTFLSNYKGNSYPIDFSLDRLENILNPDEFYRISRQFIVQFKAINKIQILSKSRIELSITGYPEPVLVSTAKTHSFRLWLDK